MKTLWFLLVLLLGLLSSGCMDDAERFLRPIPAPIGLSS